MQAIDDIEFKLILERTKRKADSGKYGIDCRNLTRSQRESMLGIVKDFRNLREFSLFNGYLKKDELVSLLETFNKNPNLETLGLVGNEFDNESAKAIAEFLSQSKVSELNLSFNSFEDEDIFVLCSAFKKLFDSLTYLAIENNHLTLKSDGFLADFIRGSKLRTLKIDDHIIGKECLAAFLANRSLLDIHFIRMFHTVQVDTASLLSDNVVAIGSVLQRNCLEFYQTLVMELKDFIHSRQAAYLILQYFVFPVNVKKNIEYFLTLQFPIDYSKIMDVIDGARSELGSLDLSHLCLMDDEAKAIIMLLMNMTFLKVLNLRHNYLGDNAAVMLANFLDSNPTVTELYLNDNEIGDVGGLSLAEAIARRENPLQYIDLRNNNFSCGYKKLLAEVISRHIDVVWNIAKERSKDLYQKYHHRDFNEYRFTKDRFLHLMQHPAFFFRKKKDGPSTAAFLPKGYDQILECYCAPAVSRRLQVGNFDGRRTIEDLILQFSYIQRAKGVSFRQDLDLKRPIKIASIGSGGLGFEVVLTLKLCLLAGFKNIHLDCVDLWYSNNDSSLVVDQRNSMIENVYQFMKLLQKAGLKVVNGDLWHKNHSLLAIQEFAYTLFKSHKHSKTCRPKGVVTISFYDSVDSYANAISLNIKKPDSIVVVDLNAFPKQDTILKPLMDAAKLDTLYFTLEKRENLKRELYHQIEVQKKTELGWVSLVDKEDYIAKMPVGKEKPLFFSDKLKLTPLSPYPKEMARLKRRNSI